MDANDVRYNARRVQAAAYSAAEALDDIIARATAAKAALAEGHAMGHGLSANVLGQAVASLDEANAKMRVYNEMAHHLGLDAEAFQAAVVAGAERRV